jgi:hypothetical protein
LEPVFLDGNLDGATYLRLLQDLMPALAGLFPNPLDPDLPDERIWYQQDGTPPHYAVIVRRYLDESFLIDGLEEEVKLNGRQVLRILLLSTFLWGYFKSKVYTYEYSYVTKPNNIEDLKQRIEHEIRQITPEMLQNVSDECYYRFAICQERNDAHFEHLLH